MNGGGDTAQQRPSLPSSPARPPPPPASLPSTSGAAVAALAGAVPHLRLGEVGATATGSMSSVGVSGYSSDECGLRSSRGGRFNRGRTQPFFIGVAGE